MPNFFTQRTVRWIDDGVELIDQTKLPYKFELVRYYNHHHLADAIRKMVVRGAPAIGVAAAMGLVLRANQSRASNREQMLRELADAAHELKSTRPTAVNISWAVERMMDIARAWEGGVDGLRKKMLEEAILMSESDVDANRKIGTMGESLLADGDVVLTHCKWVS